MKKPVCVVVGVGPGNGAAFARYFVNKNYTVALIARGHEYITQLAHELVDTHAYACDVTDVTAVKNTFTKINNDLGEITTLIFNAGSGIWGNVEEISPAAFESAWRTNTFGLLTISQQIIPTMKQNKHGNIIIVSATASRRGMIKTAAFASAKAAQRILAESMARYLWPDGIHVALIVIDGIVDLPQTRLRMPDKPDSFFVNPDDVAATGYWLTQQPPSAWSFEVEARPFAETW